MVKPATPIIIEPWVDRVIDASFIIPPRNRPYWEDQVRRSLPWVFKSCQAGLSRAELSESIDEVLSEEEPLPERPSAECRRLIWAMLDLVYGPESED
jgi:hypothetical protein